MLRTLSVQNFAIISNLTLQPGPGLTVFTGETGAGKSIVIEALSFALGARGDSSLIKDGSSKMAVEASFDADMLSAATRAELGLENAAFTVRRELDRNGKSKAAIDGKPTTVAALAQIGRELVDFHGQHEHQSLMHSSVHLRLLDQFAKLSALTAQTAAAYRAVQDVQARLNAAGLSEQEKRRLLDLYAYQLKEIEDADPKPDEDAQIEQTLPKMKHAGKLLEMCQKAYEELYEREDSAVELTGKAAREMADMAELDDALAEGAQNLQNALALLEDASAQLGAYKDAVSVDPETLDQLISRHEKLKRLKAKYGPTLADVLQKTQELKRQIKLLENAEQHEQELQKELAKAQGALLTLCRQLHEKRAAAAEKLGRKITDEIRPLGFKEVRFTVAVDLDEERPGPDGADHVEFLFAPNPGQALRPLKNIASGGEISRVMLALKAVLAPTVPVMVFDEVDAGIGGETAVLVGRKLREVATGRQVLCVTHLATVAAQAQGHYRVAKQFEKGGTDVCIEPLSGQTLTIEIARMLGGAGDKNSAAFKHAEELLQTAGEQV